MNKTIIPPPPPPLQYPHPLLSLPMRLVSKVSLDLKNNDHLGRCNMGPSLPPPRPHLPSHTPSRSPPHFLHSTHIPPPTPPPPPPPPLHLPAPLFLLLFLLLLHTCLGRCVQYRETFSYGFLDNVGNVELLLFDHIRKKRRLGKNIFAVSCCVGCALFHVNNSDG